MFSNLTPLRWQVTYHKFCTIMLYSKFQTIGKGGSQSGLTAVNDWSWGEKIELTKRIYIHNKSVYSKAQKVLKRGANKWNNIQGSMAVEGEMGEMGDTNTYSGLYMTNKCFYTEHVYSQGILCTCVIVKEIEESHFINTLNLHSIHGLHLRYIFCGSI